MTDLLIRVFLGSDFDEKDPHARTRAGFLASIVCIVCNVALCAAKAALGFLFGSISIVADAVNNLSDASSNILSLAGFKLASKPADAHHPYGHGRYEYVAGLGVAIIVLALGMDLVKESYDKLVDPDPTKFSPLLVAILVGSMLVKLWMLVFNRKLGRRIDSEPLLAAAADSRNDVITTGIILACAVVQHVTGLDVDAWAGMGMGAFITISGARLVRTTISPLLGRAPEPEYVEEVRQRILSYPGILDTHDLAVHDYGPNRGFVTAHVEMDGYADAFANHRIIDTIERDFKREHGMELTLHYDPVDTRESPGNPRFWLWDRLREIDPSITVHDLRIEGSYVTFCVVVPDVCTVSDEEVLDRAISIAHDRWPEQPCTVELDHGFLHRLQPGRE